MDNTWSTLMDSKKIKFETDALIKKSKEIRSIIADSDPNKNMLDLLADNIYEFRSYHKLCFMMSKIAREREVRKTFSRSDSLLLLELEHDATDVRLVEKIKEIEKVNKGSLEKEDLEFIRSTLDFYNKNGISNGDIRKARDKMVLCEDGAIRTGTIQSLLDLVRARTNYANLFNSTTYSDMIITEDIDSIKQMLRTIIEGIPKDRPVVTDFGPKLNLSLALKTILQIITTWFGLEFVKDPSIPTWHPNVSAFKVTCNGKNQGYLYIDLSKDEFMPPLSSVVLYEACRYPMGIDAIKTPVAVVFGKIQDSITYDIVIHLFKQFAPVVHGFFHRSSYGMINIQRDTEPFMAQLFEFIITHPETVTKFTNNDKVQAAINSFRIHGSLNDCFMSLVDLMVHGDIGQKLDNCDKMGLMINEIGKQLNIKYDMKELVDRLVNNGGLCYAKLFNGIMVHRLGGVVRDHTMMTRFIEDTVAQTTEDFKTTIKRFIEGIDKDKNKANKQDKQNKLNKLNKLNKPDKLDKPNNPDKLNKPKSILKQSTTTKVEKMERKMETGKMEDEIEKQSIIMIKKNKNKKQRDKTSRKKLVKNTYSDYYTDN